MGNRADHVLNPPLPFFLPQFSRHMQVVAHTDAHIRARRSGVVTKNEVGGGGGGGGQSEVKI